MRARSGAKERGAEYGCAILRYRKRSGVWDAHIITAAKSSESSMFARVRIGAYPLLESVRYPPDEP